MLVFGLALVVGFTYAGSQLIGDLSQVRGGSIYPFILLGVALFIALGFEFVNGFHDTANAVATVIYTHSLDPHIAVVWSGTWNFIGVLLSTGTVAFGIISLLPVELILQVGSGSGFYMVFALLTAAIIWNLGTWWFGLPSSSTHTMVGSIIGVGLANQLINVKTGTSGVDWGQALGVGRTLLLSPLVGFGVAAIFLLLCKMFIKNPKLYEAPEGNAPPPWPIRLLLICTCTGVSYAHGSNDGQKGMGLIMLILIGTVPTAYALNHAITPAQTQDFVAVSRLASQTVQKYVPAGASVSGTPNTAVSEYLRTRNMEPAALASMQQLIDTLANSAQRYRDLKYVPANDVPNFRNEMYMVSEELRLIKKGNNPNISADDWAVLDNYKSHIDSATKFIPPWVKVAVALSLGLGTMVGWKRIVVTVGEKIGKQHLSYAQGAAAEITAMLTIEAADHLSMPVSTTHVLSSGVAGTMAANHSGLQWSTVRNLLLAWVLTLPVSILLAGTLFWLFHLIG
ncbi:MAG TPA: inorganic phosphate transporter [Bryobacteraceae bacterium]|nr:inorganic phosphate transporter [Bryobacteraceae bacterium]